MPLYRIGNRTLDSNMPLPGLAEITRGRPHATFRIRPPGEPVATSPGWFNHWRGPDDRIWLSFARYGIGYLLRFVGLADFELATNGLWIECTPLPGTPIDTITHLLLDQVVPIALSMRGNLVIHASAVEIQRSAVAFVGRSGRGKSTLAASFALQGFRLMSDDCLLLAERQSELMVMPTYPGVRLWEDSIQMLFAQTPALGRVAHYNNKKRLALNNGQVHFYRGRAPLRRMYFVADPAETVGKQPITITALSAREAFMELVAHSFKLNVDERSMIAREFHLLNRIATLPLFFRLSFPHDFSLLPDVHRAILGHLDTGRLVANALDD